MHGEDRYEMILFNEYYDTNNTRIESRIESIIESRNNIIMENEKSDMIDLYSLIQKFNNVHI